MKKILIFSLLLCFSIATTEEKVAQTTKHGRTMEQIKFRYINLMKRDSYYGNKWFEETSHSLDMVWKKYPNKKELLTLSNNHKDIAKFIAYFHTNSDPETPLDKGDNLNKWFKTPIAYLNDSTPYNAVRKNTDKLNSLKFLLQQGLEPPYYPKYGVPSVNETYLDNEEEKALKSELLMLLENKGVKLRSKVNIGMKAGGNNQDTYIIFNNNWEIWYTERGSWNLVFFTENHKELIDYIFHEYTKKS